MTNMCKAVLPYMRKARKGKIINISSIGGVMGIPYQGFYSASKFAVEGYSEALALEVHPFNVKVCLVEPGDFNTGFTDNRNISELTRQDSDYGESFLNSLKIIEKEERNGCHPRKPAFTHREQNLYYRADFSPERRILASHYFTNAGA